MEKILPQERVQQRKVEQSVSLAFVVQEAEKCRDEEEANNVKIKAKHRLEICCVAARNLYTETEAGNEGKVVQDASDTLNNICWQKVDIDANQKELEGVNILLATQRRFPTIRRVQKMVEEPQGAQQPNSGQQQQATETRKAAQHKREKK